MRSCWPRVSSPVSYTHLDVYKRQAERWSDGFTANTSIGQGFVLTSPLQMASVSATVANGGKAWSPHLLKRVMDHDKAVLENPPSLRGDLSASVKPEEIEVIRRGMWKVCLLYTSRCV